MIGVTGAVFVGLGVWAAFFAASFERVVANFGPYNAHLVHDFAACSTTFGIGLLVGWRVQPWRLPVLALGAIWNGLHAISHVVDMASARTPVAGPIEAALLVAVTAVLGYWGVMEQRESVTVAPDRSVHPNHHLSNRFDS
jgi:hypothetical protein